MGRPRKWTDDAERMRARRAEEPESGIARSARELKAPSEVSNDQEIADLEEAYVKAALEQTLAHLATLTAPEKTSKLAVQERLARAETYARWRYRAWLRGEVVSL